MLKRGARAVAQWVGHLVLAPEVEAEAAEIGAQCATAEQAGGCATLAGDLLCLREPLGSAALVRVEPWHGYLLLWAAAVSRNTYPPNILVHQGRSTRPFCARLRDAGSQAGYRPSPAPMRPELCRMLQVNCRESLFPDVG
jgi:hypothetical protein